MFIGVSQIKALPNAGVDVEDLQSMIVGKRSGCSEFKQHLHTFLNSRARVETKSFPTLPSGSLYF